MTERNLNIDALRGFVCILLVGYHVVGIDADAGLRVAAGPLREINNVFDFLRMPLFTFISGFVYVYRPFRSGVLHFLRGKARRLLLPVLVVGGLFGLVRTLVPETNSGDVDNWLLFYLKPNTHFWFLEALFLIFLLVVVVEKLHILDSAKKSLALAAAIIAIHVSPLESQWLAFGSALYLLPFFFLGVLCCTFSQKLGGNEQWAWAAVIAVLVLFLFIPEDWYTRRTLFALALSSVWCVALLMTNMSVGWLARVGLYSYTIYLYHVFFTAGSRIVLGKLGIDQLYVLFVLGLVAGLLGPIVVELVLAKTAWTRLLFLGQRQYPKPVSAKATKTGSDVSAPRPAP